MFGSFLQGVSSNIIKFEEKNKGVFPIYYQLFASLAFALNQLIIKLLSRISITQIIIIRSIITLMINGMVIVYQRIKTYPTNEPHSFHRLLLRAFAGGLGILSRFSGIRLLPLSEGTVLFKTTPVWTALVAVFILKSEKFSINLFVNILLCMIGIAFIAKPPIFVEILNSLGLSIEQQQLESNQTYHSFGVFLCLFASFLGTINQVMISSLSGMVSQFTILQYFSLSCLLFASFLQLYLPYNPIIDFSFYEIILLLFIGLLGCVGQWAMNRSYFFGNLTQISMVGQSQILINFLFDIILLDESLEIFSVIGMVLIFLSLIIEMKKDKKQKQLKK